MITINHSTHAHAPGRREALRLGALSLFGGCLNTGALLALERAQATNPNPSAKSVIFMYLQGGAPTQDMWDLKPHAPSDVKTTYKPVATSAAGVQISEKLPKSARWMHRSAIVRSVYHEGPCHNNQPMYNGRDQDLRDEDARANDHPSMGSVIAWHDQRQGRKHDVPPYVFVPCALGWGEGRVKGGPLGGFLGHKYDPFATTCKPYVANPPDQQWLPQPLLGEPLLDELDLKRDITVNRLSQRRKLVAQLDDALRKHEASGAARQLNGQQKLAYDLLTSQQIRKAFDFHQEPARLRDRYGRTLFGNSAILGRRLIEAGSRFVNASYDNMNKFKVNTASWDTHENNYPMLKTLLPDFDRVFSALMQDLDERKLLDETLVVVMGEMGRTPKINKKGGRDHWTHCYSVLMAGGGIRGGTVYGESDKQAAWVKDRPVHIRDICATIYHAMGLNPEMLVYDRQNRPAPIARGGKAVVELFG